MGDSDGDRDATDLAAFQLTFGQPPMFGGILAVRDPGTVGMALLLCLTPIVNLKSRHPLEVGRIACD
jgi:hypothetical protein